MSGFKRADRVSIEVQILSVPLNLWIQGPPLDAGQPCISVCFHKQQQILLRKRSKSVKALTLSFQSTHMPVVSAQCLNGDLRCMITERVVLPL